MIKVFYNFMYNYVLGLVFNIRHIFYVQHDKLIVVGITKTYNT